MTYCVIVRHNQITRVWPQARPRASQRAAAVVPPSHDVEPVGVPGEDSTPGSGGGRPASWAPPPCRRPSRGVQPANCCATALKIAGFVPPGVSLQCVSPRRVRAPPCPRGRPDTTPAVRPADARTCTPPSSSRERAPCVSGFERAVIRIQECCECADKSD